MLFGTRQVDIFVVDYNENGVELIPTPEEKDFATAVAHRIEDYLVSLGDTAIEVFENLLALGCYGTIGDAESCPVWSALDKLAFNKYIEEVLGDCNYVNFEVDPGGICVDWSAWGGPSTTIMVEPPKPVEEFIINFDDGIYPQLDADAPTIAPSA